MSELVAVDAGGEDFLESYVLERSQREPGFPALVEEALARRRLLRELADRRGAQGVSQTVIAAAMGTSQSAVARLERSAEDAKLSTIDRYARALGCRVEWRVVDDAPH